MKKRVLSALLCGITAIAMFPVGVMAEGDGVTLNVTTTFAGTESNVQLYQDTIKAWSEETGIQWRMLPQQQTRHLKPA